MDYTMAQIKQVLKAKGNLPFPETRISRYLYDSRRLRTVEHTLFIAIRGKHHDGHDYIADLYQKGIRNFMVAQETPELPGPANFIRVDNPLRAFQYLARHTRIQSNATVIAITGSNGKTIIKEWLSQLLRSRGKVVKTPKSYNSQLGVPLSVLQLTGTEVYAVFEAGISQPGEMQYLKKILRPQWGVFTNIGSAHQEYFSSVEQKINEKLLLFREVQNLVYCADHPLVTQSVARFDFETTPTLWSWSLKGKTAGIQFQHHRDRQSLTWSWQGQLYEVPFPFVDEASIENAVHSLTTAMALGLEVKELAKVLPHLEPVSMRLELKTGRWQTTLINDAYNADLESLKIALEYFAQQVSHKPRVVILSDVLESGLPSGDLYKHIAGILEQFTLEKVYAIGPASAMLLQYYDREAIAHYNSVNDFLKHGSADLFRGRGILLKGARAFQFEKIDRYLSEKSHETVLEVHLNRMVENLNFFRNRLAPGVKTMAMVKAFGYGSGAHEISSLLQFHKVDYLAVAYADEGVALRRAGIEVPVLVLNTELSALDDLIDFHLEPEVYSFRILEALREQKAWSEMDRPLRIHLKLDTGMHRLGFEEQDLARLIRILQDSSGLKVQSVLSHLAASDDPAHREFTLQQIAVFRKMSRDLREGLGYSFDRHILNSSGITNFPEAQFEMVRLGIGLYGIAGSAAEEPFLKPVSCLKATVSQLRHVKKGESVGYGRAYMAEEDRTIAIISLGYADGLRRSLSNGTGEVAIRGQRYPIAGRICMDMTMVDVSGGTVEEGDEVEIFGDRISLRELAHRMGTIPYEVLTSISERVKRAYLME